MSAANGSDETKSRRRKTVGQRAAGTHGCRPPEYKVDRSQMQADVETGTQTGMFDWAQHGSIKSHRFRSYFDAQPGSNTKCAYCGRTIRFCYALHDQHEKTFVIGSCDFYHYKGETYKCLKAAQVLQESESERRSQKC